MMPTFIQIPCVNYRKVIRSSCISLVLKENSVMQCNECTVHLLTLDIPEGFLVCFIMVVYSGFKSKVIIPQQQFQHSHFKINKHQYSSINIQVYDSGLNKGLHFFCNQPHFIVSLIIIFDGYLEEYVLHSKEKKKTESSS